MEIVIDNGDLSMNALRDLHSVHVIFGLEISHGLYSLRT